MCPQLIVLNSTFHHQDAVLERRNGVYKYILRNLKWKSSKKNATYKERVWCRELSCLLWIPSNVEWKFQNLGEELHKMNKHAAQMPCAEAALAYLRERKKMNMAAE